MLLYLKYFIKISVVIFHMIQVMIPENYGKITLSSLISWVYAQIYANIFS